MDGERIARLLKNIQRLREEANMDDRAADATINPDARPFFKQWAVDKRQQADDIEALLAEVGG